jgi:hypothetical protein
VQLIVQAQSQPKFTLTANPTTQTVVAGESPTYAISVARSGGFAGAVAMSATGLPTGATATFNPTTVPAATTNGSTVLTIATTSKTPTGAYTINVSGTGTVNGSSTTVTTPVTLQVQTGSAFAITGDLSGTLSPGVTRPLDLKLSNPNNFALSVSNVTVSVAQTTTNTKCDGPTNFAITQLPASAYPFTLPASASNVALSTLVSSLPQVAMRDLSSNQDACKSVRLTLNYSGSASK